MTKSKNPGVGLMAIALAAILVMTHLDARAQKKVEHIQATAMGTSTQLGEIVNIDIRVFEYSTEEDRTVLLQVFQEKGTEGLANALEKMKSKGRIAITGTLGFDVNFIRSIDMPDGTRRIRFVTDRPIRFAESWSASRSSDYSLAMGEVIVSKEKGKSTGVLYPVSKFILDKDKEITIETYQNPWKLLNIKLYK